MGRELYEREAVFRTWFDKCADVVEPLLGRDLRARWSRREDGRPSTRRGFAQPALVRHQLRPGSAMAKRVGRCEPRAMLGHSVGEFVAACLADVFSLEDGLRLVARRAEMMQARPTGGMISVRLSADQLPSLAGGFVLHRLDQRPVPLRRVRARAGIDSTGGRMCDRR